MTAESLAETGRNLGESKKTVNRKRRDTYSEESLEQKWINTNNQK